MKKYKVSNQVKVDSFILFLFIATFRLPQLLPPSIEFIASLSIAIFLLIYTFLIAIKNNFVIKNISRSRFFLVFVYVVFEIIAFIRSGVLGVMDFGTVIKFIGISTSLIFFLLFSISNLKNSEDLKYFMRAIIYSFSFLIFLNFTLYLIGINPYISGNEYIYVSDGVLLSSVGLKISSAIYPLEAGPKLLGSIIVFVGVISIISIVKRFKLIFFLPILLLTILMILLSDARLYLAVLLLFVFISPFYKIISSKIFLQSYLIIFPLIPILILFIASYVAELPGIEVLSRSADDNISSLSGRTLIWSSISNEIQEFNIQLLYGYGASGTINSGINNEVAHVFLGGWENTGVKTAHNSILQQLLDKGLIGVVIFLLMFRSLIYTFKGLKSAEGITFIFGVLSMMLASSLNTLFYFASSESYVLFIILIGLHVSIFFNKNTNQSKKHVF